MMLKLLSLLLFSYLVSSQEDQYYAAALDVNETFEYEHFSSKPLQKKFSKIAPGLNSCVRTYTMACLNKSSMPCRNARRCRLPAKFRPKAMRSLDIPVGLDRQCYPKGLRLKNAGAFYPCPQSWFLKLGPRPGHRGGEVTGFSPDGYYDPYGGSADLSTASSYRASWRDGHVLNFNNPSAELVGYIAVDPFSGIVSWSFSSAHPIPTVKITYSPGSEIYSFNSRARATKRPMNSPVEVYIRIITSYGLLEVEPKMLSICGSTVFGYCRDTLRRWFLIMIPFWVMVIATAVTAAVVAKVVKKNYFVTAMVISFIWLCLGGGVATAFASNIEIASAPILKSIGTDGKVYLSSGSQVVDITFSGGGDVASFDIPQGHVHIFVDQLTHMPSTTVIAHLQRPSGSNYVVSGACYNSGGDKYDRNPAPPGSSFAALESLLGSTASNLGGWPIFSQFWQIAGCSSSYSNGGNCGGGCDCSNIQVAKVHPDAIPWTQKYFVVTGAPFVDSLIKVCLNAKCLSTTVTSNAANAGPIADLLSALLNISIQRDGYLTTYGIPPVVPGYFLVSKTGQAEAFAPATSSAGSYVNLRDGKVDGFGILMSTPIGGDFSVNDHSTLFDGTRYVMLAGGFSGRFALEGDCDHSRVSITTDSPIAAPVAETSCSALGCTSGAYKSPLNLKVPLPAMNVTTIGIDVSRCELHLDAPPQGYYGTGSVMSITLIAVCPPVHLVDDVIIAACCPGLASPTQTFSNNFSGGIFIMKGTAPGTKFTCRLCGEAFNSKDIDVEVDKYTVCPPGDSSCSNQTDVDCDANSSIAHACGSGSDPLCLFCWAGLNLDSSGGSSQIALLVILSIVFLIVVAVLVVTVSCLICRYCPKCSRHRRQSVSGPTYNTSIEMQNPAGPKPLINPPRKNQNAVLERQAAAQRRLYS